MPKLPLILSAGLLLLSGIIGFVNNGKTAAKLNDLKQARVSFNTATADANTARTKQKKAEAEAKDAQTKSTELQSSLTAATSKVNELNGQIETSTKDIEAKTAQITQLETTLKGLTTGGPIKTTGEQPELAQKVQEMEIQLTELKTVRESLENQVKSAQSNTDRLAREIAVRKSGESMNGLQGSILAVNHDWNFVVLNLGGNRGVNSNATMIVRRGGSTVGKVRITSVEPTQSIADIIPNSVPAGVIVQAGDTVVFPGI